MAPSAKQSATDRSNSLAALQQVDAWCDRFEAAWRAGKPTPLDQYLAEAPEQLRDRLLEELLPIELEYRRDANGAPLSDRDIVAHYPQLHEQLVAALHKLPTLRSSTDRQADRKDNAGAQPRTLRESQASESGLHIRCPYCRHPVELLDDMPLEEITCRSCGSNFALVDDDSPRGDGELHQPSKRIDRFLLHAPLGKGGFGTVWKSRDTDLDRWVALKIPRRGQLSRTEAELFFREARAAAQLRHPHIVPVHEVGRDGETIFIVSDLIEGVPLSAWIEENDPTFRKVAQLVVMVADALHAAHEQGVIHRDLKPSNVMIDGQGEPHLMDFGLAKRQQGEITMTIDGQILGTPAYMSPEQAGGEGHWIDRRTDIYSLGVILFQLLTGELPFRGSMHSQIQQRLEDDAPNPRRLNGQVPLDLATICLKCLERDPNRRYATASLVADELRRYLADEPIRSRPISSTARAIRWARRNPAWAAALLLTGILAVAGPAAAVVITIKNDKLATRKQEAEESLARTNAKADAQALAISQLEAQISELTAANPAARRLPDDLSLRLAQDYLEAHYTQAVAQLADLPNDSWQRAKASLALARLLQRADRRQQAVPHYKEAREILSSRVNALSIAARSAAADADRAALANCCEELSDLLLSLGQPAAAAPLAERAHTLRVQLGNGSDVPLSRRVDLLFSTSGHVKRQSSRLAEQSVVAGAESTQLMHDIEAARQAVVDTWSAEPDSVIQVADALVGPK